MQNRAKGPVPIADAIQSFFRDSGLGARSVDARVFNAWRKALGMASLHAKPLRLRGKDLFIEVDSSGLLQELKSFTGEGFRAKTNKILGSERVRRLIFKLKG